MNIRNWNVEQNSRVNVLPMLLLFFSAAVVYMPANRIGLWVIYPILFIFAGLKFKLGFDKNCNYYYIIYVCAILSLIAAKNINLGISWLFIMLTAFIGFFVFYSFSHNTANIKWLYGVFVVYNAGMWLYIIQHGIASVDITIERAGGGGTNSSIINANDLSYMTLYFNSAMWMLLIGMRDKVTGWIRFLLPITLFIFSFYVALTFASRQILILQLPLILGFLYIDIFYSNRISIRRSKVRSTVLLIIVMLVLVVLFVKIGENIFAGSVLASRYVDSDEDIRETLFKLAWKLGTENPILGIGAGNFVVYTQGPFSHSTYAELFACCGIVSAIVFILWLIQSTRIQWKRYKNTNDSYFLYMMLICIVWAAANIFYVYISSIWLLAFWGLILGSSDAYYKRLMQSC